MKTIFFDEMGEGFFLFLFEEGAVGLEVVFYVKFVEEFHFQEAGLSRGEETFNRE